MNQKFKGLAYVRVSTDADRQKNSVDLQTLKMREYIQWKGIEVPQDYFIADEESGSVPINEREGGHKIMELLRQGVAKHLIIYKLDRLGRNAIDIQQNWLYLTNELGVTIHVLDMGGDSFSSDNPMTKMMVGLISLFAEFERDRITSRIRETFDMKFKVGESIGRTPFGWRAIETTEKTKAGKFLKKIEIDPNEIIWVRRIILYHLRGGGDGKGPWPFFRIARYLNSIGLPSKEGGKWDSSSLRRWFGGKYVSNYIRTYYNKQQGTFTDVRSNEIPSVVLQHKPEVRSDSSEHIERQNLPDKLPVVPDLLRAVEQSSVPLEGAK